MLKVELIAAGLHAPENRCTAVPELQVDLDVVVDLDDQSPAHRARHPHDPQQQRTAIGQ